MMENTQCTNFNVRKTTPFLSLNNIQNFCKTIAQGMEEIGISDFTGTAIACMANEMKNQ